MKGTTKLARVAAPKHLSDEAQGLWTQVHEDFELERHAEVVLQQCLEALDRLREAQSVLARDGIIITDRFGQPKQHPATLVERDARNQMLKAWRSLGLDMEPPADRAGRPPGGRKA